MRLILVLCLTSSFIFAQKLAFPGAQGHGKYSKGGRGGRVIFVTNTEKSGEGSFRAAVADSSGPRVVVFKVGGLCELTSHIPISNPYLTILGQTAPGNGFCLKGGGINIQTSHVVVQGMRFRIGDQLSSLPAENRDNIQIGSSNDPHFIMIDHNSLSWSMDENGSTFDPCGNITWSYNIFALGLNNTRHPAAPHSMGLLISKHGVDSVSVWRNLFAHNNSRNPKPAMNADVEIENNVIYNWSNRATNIDSLATVNIRNNHYIQGPSTPLGALTYPVYIQPPQNETRLFIEGNKDDVWHPADDGSTNWNMVSLDDPADSLLNMAEFPSASFSDLPLAPVDDLWPNIMNKVGAISPQRDEIDTQVVADVDARTGSVIDTTFNVWPEYPPGTPQSDLDGDGMWDAFEILHGSNPEVPDAFDEDGEFELWQYFSHYAIYGELYREDEF